MGISYLQTSTQNYTNSLRRSKYTLEPVQQELVPTLQRKVSAKSEITLTRTQLREAVCLFRDYGMVKPGWLRTHIVINQRRRKTLNDVLVEAGLAANWCGNPYCVNDDWSGLLHKLWHAVNGRQLFV